MFKIPVISLAIMLASTPALAQDATYRKDIEPLFRAQCSKCHGTKSPDYGKFLENEQMYRTRRLGPRMDSYAALLFFVGWPDTGALMRRLDDGSASPGGKPGNMYEHLGKSEQQRQANLALFKAWIGADGWILKRWKPKGTEPAVTKEELDRIKARY